MSERPSILRSLTATPGVVSVPVDLPPVGVKSFYFPMPGATARQHGGPPVPRTAPHGAERRPGRVQPRPRRKPLAHRTHIEPPRDVIKLQDRLAFLLQPPLEALLTNHSLELPADPFPFQLGGIAFLYPRVHAILADEMGLGKSMQAITAIRLLVHARELRRVLVVCPKPLVAGWQHEFEQWAPELTLAVVEGKASRRDWIWHHAPAVVMLANYERVVRDGSFLQDPKAQFDLVVLDEAQRIKNRLSATNQAVCQIQRKRSWALTGTPVENGPEDLVGIFEFLLPGYLRPDMQARRMGREASDYILRRSKEQVLLDLPPKLFRDARVQLTSEQRVAYERAEKQGVVRLESMGRDVTIQHVFELILRLKQICNFDPQTGASAKLERLDADLEECVASGQKAIVFSQWVNSLDKLQEELERFRPLMYHGQVPPRQREQVIHQFRNDPDRHLLLISYGAGGVGLNLQCASYVFLFDRWWNPAVEDQAINRAHRIGSRTAVTVTRFVTAWTIEERIEEILASKRDLQEAILSGARPPQSLGLDKEEIFGLFQLKPPGAPGPSS